SDGMTEELILALDQVPGLRVVPRSSSFAFKGAQQDPRDIGRRLGVGAVLEGSVRQAGDRLRVIVHLVSANEGFELWSEIYERHLADVFLIQDEITRAIVGALRLRVPGGPIRPQLTLPTRSLEAHNAYLKARYHHGRLAAEDALRAVDFYQEAVRLDSTFALAWAGLAGAYLERISGEELRPGDIIPLAKAAVDRARTLDSTLAGAHVSLGLIRFLYDRDWPAAEAEFQRAIALDPALPEAHHWYSHYLLAQGQVEQAAVASRQALELSPFDRTMMVHLGWHHLHSREYDRAREPLQRALALDSTAADARHLLALLAELTGDYQGAIAQLQTALRLTPQRLELQAALGRVYALAGQPDEARRVLQELGDAAATRYVSPYLLALIMSALGDDRRAFAALEQAVADRSESMVYLDLDPRMDPLRDDRRFARVRRQVGLP
ncbi:MAG: tetratricopeptide repeat protein, partial [Gemmatimonadales bacterium]